jgi:hypothetical protein
MPTAMLEKAGFHPMGLIAIVSSCTGVGRSALVESAKSAAGPNDMLEALQQNVTCSSVTGWLGAGTCHQGSAHTRQLINGSALGPDLISDSEKDRQPRLRRTNPTLVSASRLTPACPAITSCLRWTPSLCYY